MRCFIFEGIFSELKAGEMENPVGRFFGIFFSFLFLYFFVSDYVKGISDARIDVNLGIFLFFLRYILYDTYMRYFLHGRRKGNIQDIFSHLEELIMLYLKKRRDIYKRCKKVWLIYFCIFCVVNGIMLIFVYFDNKLSFFHFGIEEYFSFDKGINSVRYFLIILSIYEFSVCINILNAVKFLRCLKRYVIGVGESDDFESKVIMEILVNREMFILYFFEYFVLFFVFLYSPRVGVWLFVLYFYVLGLIIVRDVLNLNRFLEKKENYQSLMDRLKKVEGEIIASS